MNKDSDGTWRVTLPLQVGTWAYKIVVTENGTDHWLLDWVNTNKPATITVNGSDNSRIDVKNAEQHQDPTQNQDHTFTFSGNASSVSVAGSFNGWNTTTTPMTFQNGQWSATVSLPPGSCIYKFVVDGSNWQLDSSNPFKVPDGYGGQNSSLVIGNVTEALLRVEASVGTAVDYYYNVFSAGPALYATLVAADYGDPNRASYLYEPPNFVLNRPRIKTATDPRYGSATPGARIGYTYRPGMVEGYILTEYNPITMDTYVTYDSTDVNMRTLTHGNGLVENFAVANGQVQSSSSSSDPAGNTVSYFDGGWGMAKSSSNSLNQTTTYERTYEYGVIKKITYPGGLSKQWTFPDETKPFFPSVIREKDGSIRTYTRLANGRPSRIDHNNGTYQTFTYNSRGQILTSRNVQGVTTYRAYDSSFRLISIRSGSAGSSVGLTEFTYDLRGRRASETGSAVTTPTGLQRLCKVFTYSNANRVVATTYRIGSPSGTILGTISTGYGNFGEVLLEIDANGIETIHSYDSQFRRIETIFDPGGLARTTTYEFGELGGAGGGCTCAGLNLPTRIISPDGIVTARSYDELGQLVSETIAPNTSVTQTTSFTYDSLGRQKTVTNPHGMVTTRTYRPDGQVATVTRSAPNQPSDTTSYAYSTVNGKLSTINRPDNSQVWMIYNNKHQLIEKKITNATSGAIAWKENYTYDAQARLATQTDGAGRVTTFEYDAYGRAFKVKRPDQRIRETTFDNASLPVAVTGFDNLVTTLRYDIFSRQISTSHPDGSSSAVYELLPGGDLLSSTSRGVTTTYTRDNAGRPLSQTTGSSITTYAYEDAARKTHVVSAGRQTTTVLDDVGRVSAVHRGQTNATTPDVSENYVYTSGSGTSTVTQKIASTTMAASSYDAFGRLKSSTNANSETINYAYDSQNRMTSYTDAKQATFSFEYDPAGRLIRRTEPDQTYQAYTYDLDNSLKTHRKADANILTYTYTNLGQPDMLTTSASSDSVDWSYDFFGRLSEIENQDVKLQYAYLSGSSRITTETTVVKGLGNLTRTTNLGYDSAARLDSITRPNSFSLAYGFNAAGLVASVTNDSPPPLATFTYDASGLPTVIQHENGLTTNIAYDSVSRVTSRAVKNASNITLSSVFNEYDFASRRKYAQYEDALGQAYSYDAAGQVKFAKVNIANPAIATASASPTHSFTYDSAGNRNSSLAFGQTTSYVADSVNQYISISGGGFQPPSPTYDSNGNTLTLPRNDGSSLAMTWDIHDRARTFVKGATTTNAVYDPFGRLTWTRITASGQPTLDEVWSWHSWTLLSRELFSNSAATESFRYTWGPDLSGSLEGAGGVGGLLAIERAAASSSSWEIRHVHPDANGNTLALTTATGQLSARYRYSPFGETILSQDLDSSGWSQKNIHQFSTKPGIAGTGLLYYGYRWYDPQTGRWPSRDPIGERGGINLYAFVGNDGINWMDVLGLSASLDCVRCKDDPQGPMSCVLTRSDGTTSRFNTNDPGNPTHLGQTNGPIDIDGNGTVDPDEQNLPYNYPRHNSSDPYGRYGPIAPGSYTISPRNNSSAGSNYPNGTPTINTPGYSNGTIIGGSGNSGRTNRGAVFIHGCGWSDGCMTTPQQNVNDVSSEMENGNIPMNLREICCDDGQLPPAATPVGSGGGSSSGGGGNPFSSFFNLFRR